MTTLATSLAEQRRRWPEILTAVWVRWEGQNRHTVSLRPSGREVIATGSNLTYQPGQALSVGRTARGHGGSGWVILGSPPAAARGAAAYPQIASAEEATLIEIHATVPEWIPSHVATLVYVIGSGFTETPLTEFADYDADASDPVTSTWVDDALSTLATPAWVDTGSPPAAVAGKFLPGQTIISMTITRTGAGHVSLRTT